ncbi:2-R-hydroxypropyl-CoM dehydrogenase [Sinorhizobium fredii USDA 205]|uniref:SDR family oxidoreductase n=1 Tax=Rhizobium fredii TaxID=380 RepID=A0A844A4P2_RHIFR|nr:SDR family oxidoreductase [Sinorhizobium fredii]ASY72022.1 3-oxoacyl-[acyl-carrier protein] reductase [Sinorhizobium fredii CCBAU 83666]KSV83380.1 2-R-hydroxypropyl-CoM dehydrogenase [Sinorhizobium fredii USDA 205]MQX08079.1 SDR family oxidoreductase [Sinorhizobium fredii]GEC30884.1 3-ketoacyl-ACP reductase [Sinorhizobium fredii]GLS10435.1 3-ketoacyl-ACP reductase [Sinorhizobium fredii]
MSRNATARIAVVTGGSSGIGLATARHLLQRGCRVAVFGQRRTNVESAAEALSRDFGSERVFARAVELAEPAQIEASFQELQNYWGKPEILVCSAGISPKGPDGPTPFEEITLDEWNAVLSVNLTGTLLCCQAAMPGMVAQGFGRIVLVGSIAGRALPKIAGTAYVASKAALAGLARSLVARYAAEGITVNVVAPGRIATEMAGPRDSAVNRAAVARIPAGRLGEPAEVAAVICFLASDEAAYVNGVTIDVNGGEYAPL